MISDGFGPLRMTYVVQYRQHGRTRRFTIGDYGPLAPDQARERAKIRLGKAATGKDPAEQRRAERAVRAFAEVANEFVRVGETQRTAASALTQSYIESDRRSSKDDLSAGRALA
jgi:hypothetical protein